MRTFNLRKTKLILVVAISLCSTVIRAQGGWSPASTIGLVPTYKSVAVTANGKLFLIGGKGTSDTVSIQIFDPVSNRWSIPAITGKFKARSEFAACVIDQRIYVVGGFNTDVSPKAISDLQIFDISTNTWSTPITNGEPVSPRFGLAAVAVDGKMFVFGGRGPVGGSGYTYLTDTYVFDPPSLTWEKIVTKGTYSSGYGVSGCAIGSTIFAIDGFEGLPTASVQSFDITTKTWSDLKTEPHWELYYAASFPIGDQIYVVGTSRDHTIERFDPELLTWPSVIQGGAFTSREYFAVGNLGRKLYAVGGDVSFAINEVFDLDKSSVAGISERSSSAWPNPTAGIERIETTSRISSVNVFTLTGVEVNDVSHSIEGPSVRLDMSRLHPGLYFVRVTDHDGIVSTFAVTKDR